jgi:cytochrome c556
VLLAIFSDRINRWFHFANNHYEKGRESMEQAEIQEKIYAYMEQMKGKKKLKEKDIIKKISADTEQDKDVVKKALRAMIDVGKLMYSYGGGASSVEIPSEEYLKEKGLL